MQREGYQLNGKNRVPQYLIYLKYILRYSTSWVPLKRGSFVGLLKNHFGDTSDQESIGLFKLLTLLVHCALKSPPKISDILSMAVPGDS